VRWRTHVAMGYLALPSLWLSGQLTVSNLPLALALLPVGSLLPDVHHPPVKRNAFLHSLVGAAAVSLAASLFAALWAYTLGLAAEPLGFRFVFRLLFASYLLHLLGDAMTGGGIYIAWPFSGRRFRITAHRYDDPALNSIFTGLGLLSLLATSAVVVMQELGRVLYP